MQKNVEELVAELSMAKDRYDEELDTANRDFEARIKKFYSTFEEEQKTNQELQ